MVYQVICVGEGSLTLALVWFGSVEFLLGSIASSSIYVIFAFEYSLSIAIIYSKSNWLSFGSDLFAFVRLVQCELTNVFGLFVGQLPLSSGFIYQPSGSIMAPVHSNLIGSKNEAIAQVQSLLLLDCTLWPGKTV